VVRSGSRVRRGCLVLHRSIQLPVDEPVVGFVVARSVGGSVVRHAVVRRLRAQVMMRLDQFPPRSATVVRALPGAAKADSAQLGTDLDAGLRALARRR
jgi:ribonuclease P protein component